MRILVTGSEGFIGKHVVAALRARGDMVLEADPRGATGAFEGWASDKTKGPEGIIHLGAITDTLVPASSRLI